MAAGDNMASRIFPDAIYRSSRRRYSSAGITVHLGSDGSGIAVLRMATYG